MTVVRTYAGAVLLLAILALVFVGVAPSTAEAAPPPLGCSFFNCNGGPWQCVTVAVGYGGATVSVTCYMPPVTVNN